MNEWTIEQLEERLAQLMEIAEKREEQDEEKMAAYVEERKAITSELESRKAQAAEAAEKREAVANDKTAEVIKEFREDDKKMENTAMEYRAAWLKHVRGMMMDEAEQRAYSNAQNAGAEVIPEQTANEILTKVKKLAPMLGEITLLHVNGAVRYAVEGTNNAAGIHSENAQISAAEDTLAEVSLSGYEIVKLVQVSDTVKTMSIDVFESWLTDNLAEAIARKIEALIISGTGSSQPAGINTAQEWGNTNSVTVAANASLTAANVQTLIGLLPAGYDAGAKFVMSKKTLFTDFMPLQDNSKNHIVSVQGRDYYIYGYPVLISDYMDYHTAFLGDFKKVIGNLSEAINVKSAYDIDHNAYKYSGIAIFDCDVGIGEAIVKLAKGS